MNNKPVAWMKLDEVLEHFKSVGCGTVYETGGEGRVPLYTHPVKEEAEQQSYQEADGCPTELAVLKRFWRQHNPVKELTQQEIDKIENSVYLKTIAKGKPIGSYGQELVKAILRKAQEKC